MKKIAVILSLAILLVYLFTTSPYLQAGDSAEMAAVTISRGVPHQPSYPVYTLVTHLITKLPIPYFPDAINLPFLPEYSHKYNSAKWILIYRSGAASAIYQAIGAGYLFLLLVLIGQNFNQQGTKERAVYILSGLTTAAYSFSTTIWLYATKPEVFALNNMFALMILYYACKYWLNSTQKKFPKKLALLYGLAFAHHQTILLILPMLIAVYIVKNSHNSRSIEFIKTWLNYPFDKKFNRIFPYWFLAALGVVPFMITLWFVSQAHPIINWGEISSPIGIVRALFRADYGTIGAYLSNTQNPTLAIDQIPFFLEHIKNETSVYLLLISIMGCMVMYRHARPLYTVLLVGFLVSGPIFLMYANFALDSDFSKATVIRFYMTPMLFIYISAFYGLLAISRKINDIKQEQAQLKEFIGIGKVLFLAITTIAVILSAHKNIPVYDNLTYIYARTVVNSLEDNAIVLVTGDIATMTMQYMQAVEGEKKNRIIFSPGQFHLDWFQKQLRTRYPDLKVPDPLPGKQFTTATQVVKANWGTRPIYLSPEFVDIDPEINTEFVLWPKGLILKAEQKGTEYKLEEYLESNTKLFNSINLSEIAKLRSKRYQLESPLINFYSRHFYNVGAVLNSVHKYDDALVQFDRSLNINPEAAENYKAIANIYYATPDFNQRNPMIALENYNRFLQFANNITVEEYNTVVTIINTITEDLKRQEQIEMNKAASESATME